MSATKSPLITLGFPVHSEDPPSALISVSSNIWFLSPNNPTVFSVAISHLSTVTMRLSRGVITIPIFLLSDSSASSSSLPLATL